jgi:hypothetical protein
MYTKKLILNRINTYVFANDRGVGLVISLASENLSAVKRIILAEYILPVTAIPPPSQAPVCLLTVNSLITPSQMPPNSLPPSAGSRCLAGTFPRLISRHCFCVCGSTTEVHEQYIQPRILEARQEMLRCRMG